MSKQYEMILPFVGIDRKIPILTRFASPGRGLISDR